MKTQDKEQRYRKIRGQWIGQIRRQGLHRVYFQAPPGNGRDIDPADRRGRYHQDEITPVVGNRCKFTTSKAGRSAACNKMTRPFSLLFDRDHARIRTIVLLYIPVSEDHTIGTVNKMAAGERQPSVEVAEIVSLEEKVAKTDVSRGCLDEGRGESADVERVLCFCGNDRKSGEMACCELCSGWFHFRCM